MAKRAAAIQLTSDNYEEDDQNYDEPGRFEQASEDQLKQRVIKKAARRTNMASGTTNSGGLFSNLKPTATSGPFSLGGSTSTGLVLLGRAPLSSTNQSTSSTNVQSNGLPLSGDGGGKGNGNVEYLQQLQALNIGVSKWISGHVEKNPHVDLTPIFRDYEKHLKTIDMKYKPTVSETESSQESESGDISSQVTTETGEEEETTGAGGDEESFEQQHVASSATSSQDSEDSSLLSVRAKLFYKKKDEYTELGVGTLKVQSSSGQSICLLLRNDTSLGNILMNVRLTAEVPMTLTKNNLIVVCPANPPLGKEGEETGPVTYLIRVKTTQQAEQLHSVIKDSL